MGKNLEKGSELYLENEEANEEKDFDSNSEISLDKNLKENDKNKLQSEEISY